jgi:signal transduction histidine kinase
MERDGPMGQKIKNDGKNNMPAGCSFLKPSIDESWERCMKYGLNRNNPPKAIRVSDCRLEKLLAEYRDLLSTAQPYMDILALGLSGYGSIVGLASNDGVLLKVKGKVEGLMDLGYQKGFGHTELNMGTNAIGMCLETESPIVICGEEHFFRWLWGWAGFAAPLNIDNQLGAVIFAMVPIEFAYRELLEIISLAAYSINKQLELTYDKEKLLYMYTTTQNGRKDIMEASSIISHEVKNSLTNISAYIQLLQLEKGIAINSSSKILNEISRVTRLLDDFRLLSRHDYDNTQLHSIRQIIKLVKDIMMSKARLSNVDIICDSHKEDIYIKADKNSLQQVFINLIDNAIDAMKDGGTLTIGLRTESNPDMAVISFRDTGTGIPPEQLQNIFKIYEITKETGTGLGLHICQTIVRFYGGTIEVDSIPGRGSTFTVKLPRAYRI